MQITKFSIHKMCLKLPTQYDTTGTLFMIAYHIAGNFGEVFNFNGDFSNLEKIPKLKT